jgi:glucosylceramidase
MPNNIIDIIALFGLAGVPSIYSKKDISNIAFDPAALSATTPAENNDVDFWLTKGDQTALLQKQTKSNWSLAPLPIHYFNITVDNPAAFSNGRWFWVYTDQWLSATVINNLGAGKAPLLQELFGSAANSIGISYLRISIGAL